VFVCYANKIHAGYRAGDITYRWIQGYTYEIKYTTYTDDVTLPDNKCRIDSVCFGDGVNSFVTRINGNCNGACSPYCDGSVILPGVRMSMYTVTHTYPGPGAYTICFKPVNRSAGIANITNSVNQQMNLESSLVISSFSGPNTSPTFVEYPITTGCINHGCFYYNAGAADVDGDSLAYSFVTYANTPGFSWPYGTAGTFSINPVTGILSWCDPPFSGDFNVCIKTEEWRGSGGNKSLVGYTKRDTEFRMDVCAGIKDNENTLAVNVYPNPVSETITLTVTDLHVSYTVELMDLTGRKVKTFLKDVPCKEHQLQFNLDGLDSGAYFITITGNHQTLTKKLIKQ
jgi:hypothetical protein